MHKNCPGTQNITTPELRIKTCPCCGSSVEIFSDEVHAHCVACGQKIYNDVQSCVQWCRYAIDCVGEDMYQKLRKPNIYDVFGNE